MSSSNVTDLSIVLHNTLSPDQSIRQGASRMLEEAARSYGLANYMSTLIGLLSREGEAVAVRIAAGLAAKNALVNRRDSVKQSEMTQRWLHIPSSARQPILQASLVALSASSPAVGTTAAQVVAAIACAELSVGEWNELLPSLVKITTDSTTSTPLKRASVETIGFICEESDRIGPVLELHSNSILTAVVNGTMSGEMDVRVASCKALLSCLEFAHSAFSHPTERAFIMQRVCETAAQTINSDLTVIAFQCLVKIVNLYYHCLSEFMAGGLEQLTIAAMQRSDAENIQLQAIEFWSTICETELDLADQLSDGQGDTTSISDFAKNALPRLLPILLWLLTQHPEEHSGDAAGSDDWTPSMAAATCLSLLAGCVGDAIVADGTLLSFVQSNIQNNADWRKREAAAMAFGSVLDGPDHRKMSGLVVTAMPLLISLLADSSVAVRDTAAWCIGEACRGFVDSIPADLLPTLAHALITGLQDRPRVAANCAWSSAHLVEQLADSAIVDSSLFFHIMNGLLQAAIRSDSGEANLRTCAFQALANVIGNAPIASRPMVDQLANYLVSQSESLSNAQVVNADDRMHTLELQGHYAAVLQSAIGVLDCDQVLLFSDRLMVALFSQLALVVTGAASRPPTPNYVSNVNSDGTVDEIRSPHSSSTAATWEDLLLLLGSLISSIGGKSAKYLEGMTPVLTAALSGAYHLETSFCTIAIIVIGETAQALKDDFKGVALHFIQLLASCLSSNTIGKSVKPKAIAAIGDIALAIGPSFCNSPSILSLAMPILMQAAQAVSHSPSDLDDWEHVDFVVEMRLSLVESFTCIVQSASDDPTALHHLVPFIPFIISFLKSIVITLPATDRESMVNDSLLKASIGLLGDLAAAYGASSCASVIESLKDTQISSYLSDHRWKRNTSESVDKILRWASSQIARL